MLKAQDMSVETADIQAQHQQVIGQMELNKNAAIQQLKDIEANRITTTYQSTGGNGSEILSKWLTIDKALEEQGYTREQRAAARAQIGVPAEFKPGGETKRETEARGSIDARRVKYAAEDKELTDEEVAMQSAAKSLGGTYDPATGELNLPEDLKGRGFGPSVGRAFEYTPLGFGARVVGLGTGESYRDASLSLKNLVDVKQRQRSGAAAPASEVETFKFITEGDNLAGIDEDATRNALQLSARSIYARRQAAQLGAGEDVLQSWEDQKKALPKPIQVTPR
jgi:hypothetical protein